MNNLKLFMSRNKCLIDKLYPCFYANLIYCRRHIATTGAALGIKARWRLPFYLKVQKRIDEMKKDGTYKSILSRRSNLSEWNYDAELYAFGKRLNEDFSGNLLHVALTENSFIMAEERNRKGIEMEGSSSELNLESNLKMAQEGKQIIIEVCEQYLRTMWKHLPEEGIQSAVEFLTSVEVLANVAHNLGMKDIILTDNYPPDDVCFARCFCATVAALKESSGGIVAARGFVVDFVAAQIRGQELGDFWQIEAPLQVLNDLLIQSGREEAEPRLIAQLGGRTLEAVFYVGLYSSKIMLASGYGDCLDSAVKMAALNSLQKLFAMTPDRMPLKYSHELDQVKLNPQSNTPLKEWNINEIPNIVNY